MRDRLQAWAQAISRFVMAGLAADDRALGLIERHTDAPVLISGPGLNAFRPVCFVLGTIASVAVTLSVSWYFRERPQKPCRT